MAIRIAQAFHTACRSREGRRRLWRWCACAGAAPCHWAAHRVVLARLRQTAGPWWCCCPRVGTPGMPCRPWRGSARPGSSGSRSNSHANAGALSLASEVAHIVPTELLFGRGSRFAVPCGRLPVHLAAPGYTGYTCGNPIMAPRPGKKSTRGKQR